MSTVFFGLTDPPPFVFLDAEKRQRTRFLAPASEGGGGSEAGLVYEDFEGAGVPPLWTGSGTGINFDFSSAPWVLEGAQSLLINNNTSSALSPVIATVPLMSGALLWRCSNFANSPFVIVGRNGDHITFTELFRIRVNSAGGVSLQNGDGTGGTASADGTLLINTAYRFWVDYVPGTGADGRIDFYHVAGGASAVKPGSPTHSKTDLTATLQWAYSQGKTGVNSTNVSYDVWQHAETGFLQDP